MHNEFDENNLPIPIAIPFGIPINRSNELLSIFISHVIHNAMCMSCGEIMSVKVISVTLDHIPTYCKNQREAEYICMLMGQSYKEGYWEGAMKYAKDTEIDTMLDILQYLNERRKIKISPAN